MQENFAKQIGGLHPRVAHADGVCLVYFWSEESTYQGKEDFAKDCCPFLMIGGS